MNGQIKVSHPRKKKKYPRKGAEIPRREMESNAKRQTRKRDLEIRLIKNLKALFVKNIINNPNVLR